MIESAEQLLWVLASIYDPVLYMFACVCARTCVWVWVCTCECVWSVISTVDCLADQMMGGSSELGF